MKRTLFYILTIIIAGLLTNGCSSPKTDPTDNHKNSSDTFDISAMKIIIEEKNNQFTKAHITGDTAFLNNIFTRDARVFAPNAEKVVGHSAIAALNLEYINFGINEFSEETTALYGNEDYLINEGIYYMSYGKDSTKERGKFINIWKKADGDWKMYSNIWNTNMPLTPAK